MSTKGVYTALSGALAQNLRLDTIANNIANVNTPSFKKDQQTFREYLTANEKPSDVIQVPRIPASVESFYDMQGGDKSFVDSNGTYTDFSQGSLKTTGNPLDVAIDGQGMFEVMTPAGVRYTRSGSFSVDGLGQVVTKDGFPLLMEAPDGTDPQNRIFKVNSSQVQIADNGEVFDQNVSLGKIALAQFDNKDALRKMGNNLYEEKAGMTSGKKATTNTQLKQGFLELSNVNVVQEMTDMITAQRVFESTQKAIHSYDEMNEKLVNVVGKVTG